MPFTIADENTATNPVTAARSLAPDPINYGADFRVVSESPNEVVLTCLKAPLLAPENVRIAFSEVSDMFKGTKIDPAYGALENVIKRGCSVLIQLTGVGADDTEVRYPYSAHLVLKLPYGAQLEASDIVNILERLLGHLYATGAATPTSRLESLVRGAVAPTEL